MKDDTEIRIAVALEEIVRLLQKMNHPPIMSYGPACAPPLVENIWHFTNPTPAQ